MPGDYQFQENKGRAPCDECWGLGGLLGCSPGYLRAACCLHSPQGMGAEQRVSLQVDWITEEDRLFPRGFHSSQCHWQPHSPYYGLPESMNSEKQWRRLYLRLEWFLKTGKLTSFPYSQQRRPSKRNWKYFRVVSEIWKLMRNGKQSWLLAGCLFQLTVCLWV